MTPSGTLREENRAAFRRLQKGRILAVVILLISFAATFWTWHTNRRGAFERARIRFHQEVERVRLSILGRLAVYEGGLYGTRSLFLVNSKVTRKMFRDYITNLGIEQRYPGIQGIGFTEYIKSADLQAHTAEVRREGFPTYQVHPDYPRDEYTSIVYLEPFDWRNQRAFGYDMFTEPIRRRAMEHARDTGDIGITSKVVLVQETDQDVQPGFLMYLPLYKSGVPLDTVADRREALRGYIYSPFRVGNLLNELIQERPPLANFELFGAQTISPDSLMYRLVAPGTSKSSSVQETSTLQLGGQNWTLLFYSSPEFDRVVTENTNPFIIPAGLAISFLLFGITISISQTERRAIRLAEEMTARLRESERSILDMNKELTEALYQSEKLAISGRLMATMAHEINNPLEALTNLLYVLKSLPAGDPRAQEFISQAQDQLALLTNISRQTLAPYRSTALPVPTNISELLDDVLSIMRTKLTASSIQVDRRYPPSVEVTIYPSELRQVFTNLIANAIDAMGRNGLLAITVETCSDNVSVAISDNGHGIPRDRLEHIFEPFFSTKGDKGIGVGLWIVKTIVAKLGGTIEVRSATGPEDHGTTFTVVIPKAVRQQPAPATLGSRRGES